MFIQELKIQSDITGQFEDLFQGYEHYLISIDILLTLIVAQIKIKKDIQELQYILKQNQLK